MKDADDGRYSPTLQIADTLNVTGPISPDSTGASPFFQSRQLVNVNLPEGLSFPS
jgi:hypothetical protein